MWKHFLNHKYTKPQYNCFLLVLTLLVQKTEHSWRIRSIPSLLMPWLLLHEQEWFKIKGSFITYQGRENIYKSVRSQKCGCLVTWFFYQLIAKPGNNTVPFHDLTHVSCFLQHHFKVSQYEAVHQVSANMQPQVVSGDLLGGWWLMLYTSHMINSAQGR